MPRLSDPPTTGLAVVPGETAPDWHSFGTDRAAVIAAVGEVAPAFELRSIGKEQWILGSSEPAVNGVLTIRTDTATTTSVGLQIAPVPPESAVGEALNMVMTLWPLWLIVAAGCVAFGMHRYVAIVSVLIGAAVLVLPVAGVVTMLEASRVRRDRLWIAEWRGRFLPALANHITGDLSARPPYR